MKIKRLWRFIPLSLLLVATGVVLAWAFSNSAPHPTLLSVVKSPTKKVVATPPPAPNPCQGNQLQQMVLVSISKRHLWACQLSKQLYDSPVVTGYEGFAADLTPPGTYHIYGKETDQKLTGSDQLGSWNVYVYYWMPFLDNQYGQYGFHDATWRQPSAFGNISPNSTDASHGCVELPLSTAQWLYDWVQIGTTVVIQT